MTSQERRLQVARVALTLLGELPLRKLTTRVVAKRVGVSQPSLFRHFRSRDEILSEVVALVRVSLGGLAEAAIEEEEPLVALRAFVQGVFAYSTEHPGLPRLIFFDASDDEPAPFHAPLRALVSMQKGLLTQLIGDAQEKSALSTRLSPERAAFSLLSLLQGTLLQWLHGGCEFQLADTVDEIFSLLGGGEDDQNSTREESTDSRVQGPDRSFLGSLDVRPILATGVDPLEEIHRVLATLACSGALEMVAPFRPVPLIRLLEKKGCCLVDEELEQGVWRLWIRKDAQIPWLDLRELPAPEPFEQVLVHCARLEPGESLLALVPKLPRLLFPKLEQRALMWEVQESIDQSALLFVRRPQL